MRVAPRGDVERLQPTNMLTRRVQAFYSSLIRYSVTWTMVWAWFIIRTWDYRLWPIPLFCVKQRHDLSAWSELAGSRVQV